jgi:hypothetical protein
MLPCYKYFFDGGEHRRDVSRAAQAPSAARTAMRAAAAEPNLTMRS